MIEQESTRITDQPIGLEPRVFLQPIAAPSILGLYGLAASTFIIAAFMAHWFGTSETTLYFVPFAALFGGLAQFLSGMWAFKARDGVATAVHGMWGAFFMAFGLMALIAARNGAAVGGPVEPGAMFPAMGYWFIVLAAITWVCMLASSASNASMTVTTGLLAAGSTLSAIGLLAGRDGIIIVAGYFFVGCAIAAWYGASALMLQEAFGREVWTIGRQARAIQALPLVVGPEPGVIHGQA